AVREHDGHLQDRLDLVADVVRGRLGEGLRTVTALEDERLPAARRGELVRQDVGLAREHERRQARELRGDLRELRLVRPHRLLGGLERTPALEPLEQLRACLDAQRCAVCPMPARSSVNQAWLVSKALPPAMRGNSIARSTSPFSSSWPMTPEPPSRATCTARSVIDLMRRRSSAFAAAAREK